MYNNKEHYNYMKGIIDELKQKVLDCTPSDERLTQVEYVNLGISRLHNVFFELYSEKNDTTKTQLLRDFLNSLMKRNPDVLNEAKELIKQEYKEDE